MKRIIFICEANSIRSQLAEGLAKRYWLGRNVQIESAGRCSCGYVNQYVKKILLKMKIDYSLQFSKSFLQIPFPDKVDIVVILCEYDFIGNYFPNAFKYHLPLNLPYEIGSNNVLDIMRIYQNLVQETLKIFHFIKF